MDGSCVIRVSAKDRNAAKSMLEARKMAVYEVVFNGVPSATATVNSLKPLIRAKADREGWSEDQLAEFIAQPVFELRPERLSVEDFIDLTLKLA